MTDTELILYTTHARSVVWEAVIEQWGDQCFYCDKPWDDAENAKHSRTIDHYHSQHYGLTHGWSAESIHGLDNLRPAGKSCNAVKANREWIDENTLAPKPHTKLPKAKRPDLCDTCMSGRLLLGGETCPDCGGGPQPSTAPKYLQVSPKECSHGWGDNPEQFCWMCFCGHIERKPAIDFLIEGP